MILYILQELMLLKENLGILKKLNTDFSCTACVRDVKGSPSKGIAIFYRNSLSNYIKVSKYWL